MRSIVKSPVLVGLVFLLAGGAAREATLVDVRVPFPFVVRNQVLPAGQYRVEQDGYHLKDVWQNHADGRELRGQ